MKLRNLQCCKWCATSCGSQFTCNLSHNDLGTPALFQILVGNSRNGIGTKTDSKPISIMRFHKITHPLAVSKQKRRSTKHAYVRIEYKMYKIVGLPMNWN